MAAASTAASESSAGGFLTGEKDAILSTAAATVERTHLRHYEADARTELRRRLEAVYDAVVAAFECRDLSRVVELGQELARRRYAAGYDLSEVQTALNSLEEAIWLRAFEQLSPAEFARVITPTSTILGAAKDALAREYVSLATRGHAPAIDLTALFAGPT